MDSISQAALGSAVALVVTRGRSPKRAILIGATIGTLPDLDVLISFDNDLDAMTRHRSWSHSWLVQTMISPLLAVFIGYFASVWSFTTRLLLCFLVLVTHSALDGLTIYGTWLFWPFGQQPVMGGSIFIIDPLFTLPLVVAAIWIWRNPDSKKLVSAAVTALILSNLYLGWGLFAKSKVESIADESLKALGLEANHLVATPTPFNSILWRVIAVNDGRFHEGFFNFLDGTRQIRFNTYDRGLHLLSNLDNRAALQQFSNFNHDYYALSLKQDLVVGQDLRMGAEPFYFFQFEFARLDASASETAPELLASIPMASAMAIDPKQLFGWLVRRLFFGDQPALKSQRKVSENRTQSAGNAVKS